MKINPQALIANLLLSKVPQQLIQKVSKPPKPSIIPSDEPKIKPPTPKFLFSFALVADSHNDNLYLAKALSQSKQRPDVKFVVGLGDYTDVGTIRELEAVKKEFDTSGIRYFLTSGDHDLWDARNKSLVPTSNFQQIFGPPYQSFNLENFLFILLDNSDNYQGLGQQQTSWLLDILNRAKTDLSLKGIFVFVHQPLFHPSSDHVMGRVEASLKLKARTLIANFKEAGVKRVFAGDTHFFSEYNEPETNLAMVTIGAVTIQRNPQLPRFALVSVFDDGSTKVEDVEVK